MKKNSRFAGFYMGLIFFLMYLPIAVVIVFSFNESKLPVKFTGFSLKWYQELIHDRAMLEALVNSLILGVLSCLVSAVIGTLGWPVKDSLEVKRGTGIHFHIAVNDTGDHPWYGADGILLYAEPAFWHADTVNRSYGILCALYSDGSEGKTGGNGPCVGRGGKGSGCRTFPGILGYYAAVNYAGCNFRFVACVCHVHG